LMVLYKGDTFQQHKKMEERLLDIKKGFMN
jgi:hypothetical protein